MERYGGVSKGLDQRTTEIETYRDVSSHDAQTLRTEAVLFVGAASVVPQDLKKLGEEKTGTLSSGVEFRIVDDTTVFTLGKREAWVSFDPGSRIAAVIKKDKDGIRAA